MTKVQQSSAKRTTWPCGSVMMTLSVLILFALAYSQAPLFTSNQNQYFLHGAAAAKIGSLDRDWLANTVDPTPVFSTLVRLTFLLRLPHLFHVYYFVLLGVYLYSIWSLLGETIKPDWTPIQRWIVLVLLIGIHSFAFRYSLSRLLGQEWRFILEGGFAGQRLLGTVFQPSTFGVFLLLGIVLFIRDHPISAVISVVLAATIHPTYLLSAALLILAFMLVSWRATRSLRQPMQIGLLALLLVSPTVWYTWTQFQPTSSRLTELASQILVEERIPNHILFEEWLDTTVLVQSGMILLAIFTFRKRPIAVIMATIAGSIFLLTLLQIESGNQRLALLFPWRPSALLVPIASTLLVGITADRIFAKQGKLIDANRNVLQLALGILLLVLAGLGIVSYLHDMEGKKSDTARPMFDFIQDHHIPGDRFFIPPKKQEFRLATGAPVLVDFKSIPYVDTEVIEWYERLRTAQYFYRDRVSIRTCGQIDKAVALGAINHVVLGPDQHGLECPNFTELVFSDDSYQVYKLKHEE